MWHLLCKRLLNSWLRPSSNEGHNATNYSYKVTTGLVIPFCPYCLKWRITRKLICVRRFFIDTDRFLCLLKPHLCVNKLWSMLIQNNLYQILSLLSWTSPLHYRSFDWRCHALIPAKGQMLSGSQDFRSPDPTSLVFCLAWQKTWPSNPCRPNSDGDNVSPAFAAVIISFAFSRFGELCNLNIVFSKLSLAMQHPTNYPPSIEDRSSNLVQDGRHNRAKLVKKPSFGRAFVPSRPHPGKVVDYGLAHLGR